MRKLNSKQQRWMIAVLVIVASVGAINFAIAQSSISLNSSASFPVDI